MARGRTVWVLAIANPVFDPLGIEKGWKVSRSNDIKNDDGKIKPCYCYHVSVETF